MYIKDNVLDIDKIIDDFSGYLYTIIQNAGNFIKEDIEEIISDTYLILWNNQYKLDLDKKLSSYLVGIVKNLIKQKYKIFNNSYDNIESYEDILITNEGLDVVIENNEVNRKIIELLKKELWVIELMSPKVKEKEVYIDGINICNSEGECF